MNGRLCEVFGCKDTLLSYSENNAAAVTVNTLIRYKRQERFFPDPDTTTSDSGSTTTNFMMRKYDDLNPEALETSRKNFISTIQQGKKIAGEVAEISGIGSHLEKLKILLAGNQFSSAQVLLRMTQQENRR